MATDADLSVEEAALPAVGLADDVLLPAVSLPSALVDVGGVEDA